MSQFTSENNASSDKLFVLSASDVMYETTAAVLSFYELSFTLKAISLGSRDLIDILRYEHV